MKHKYPFHYYLFLFIALVISILFWIFVLKERMEQGGYAASLPTTALPSLPNNYYTIKPIDRDKIIIDTIGKRQIVADLLNVAIKDTTYQTKHFLQDFIQKFDTIQYKINYVDSTINYIQLKVANEIDREGFKQEVKQKLPNYSLLVWDEALFDMQTTNRYMNRENLYPLQKITANNIKVAVVDNGFDLQHPSLKGKWINPYNATDNSSDVRPSPINHGTAVASIIVGNRFNDIEGIVPTAQLIPIKVSDANGYMSSTYIIKGVLYAIKQQADVVNLSLGAKLDAAAVIPETYQKDYIKNGAKDEESFWKELFSYAENNKTIIVLAAGNDGILTGFDPMARAENTIKVGAVNEYDQKSDFSNYGTLTTIYAQGENVKVASPNQQTEILQGTSFSAPIVSAFIAALKSKYPQYTSTQIIEELKRNTVQQNQLTILYNKTF